MSEVDRLYPNRTLKEIRILMERDSQEYDRERRAEKEFRKQNGIKRHRISVWRNGISGFSTVADSAEATEDWLDFFLAQKPLTEPLLIRIWEETSDYSGRYGNGREMTFGDRTPPTKDAPTWATWDRSSKPYDRYDEPWVEASEARRAARGELVGDPIDPMPDVEG